MQSSEELFNRKLKALNGNMGPPAASTQGKPEGGGKANGTPAMPKMGVRARVSEWPPKKENWESRGGPNYESVIMAFQNGQLDQSIEIPDVNEAPLDLDCPDTKYSLNDLLNRSPLKGLHPIRQRSNSDVTISDIDAEDIMDQNAVNPNTGASLHREYGSTSSIDRQGLGGDGFFTLLKGYRVDTLDHRSIPQLGFPELLRCDAALSPSLQTAAQIARGEIVRISGYDYVDSSLFYSREREKNFMRRLKSESSETSLFRKLRTIKSEHDGFRLSMEQDDRRPLGFQKCFAHYDVQSVLFNVSEAVANRANLGQRKNTTTGASAASQYQVPGGGAVSGTAVGPPPIFESPLGSHEDLNPKENLDADEGDGKSNGLVLSCPHFRNEIGGEGERRISLSRANSATYSGSGENCSFESSLSSHCTNAGVSVLEVPRENQPIHREKVKRYIIEHIDLGAYYYHKYFYGRVVALVEEMEVVVEEMVVVVVVEMVVVEMEAVVVVVVVMVEMEAVVVVEEEVVVVEEMLEMEVVEVVVVGEMLEMEVVVVVVVEEMLEMEVVEEMEMVVEMEVVVVVVVEEMLEMEVVVVVVVEEMLEMEVVEEMEVVVVVEMIAARFPPCY
ncbi:hypothetical protein NFI96_003435 [Prochilodus magdalenae]|nr:hypothetical protein NFI96_003435 [Prochilodus magdalenae]